MSRADFLQWRIEALERSIAEHKKVIDMCETMPDVVEDERESEIKEMNRRIDVDSKLLASRQEELSKL